MDYFPGNWGQPRSREEHLFDSSDWFGGHTASDAVNRKKIAATSGPTTRTQQPIVTGTSVLGIKFKDGVMLAADNLASYGSLARFRDVERLLKVGDFTVVGASGDISDFQAIKHMLDTVLVREFYTDDGHKLGPNHVHQYLSRVMYARRSNVNPLWNSLVVGGFRDGKKFLGYVDLQGTTYEASTIATGFGGYLAQPILRKAVEGREDTLTEEEAVKLIDDAMRVLYYRDARSINKFQRATITKDGIKITEPYSLETNWSFAESIRGYGA